MDQRNLLVHVKHANHLASDAASFSIVAEYHKVIRKFTSTGGFPFVFSGRGIRESGAVLARLISTRFQTQKNCLGDFCKIADKEKKRPTNDLASDASSVL